MAAVDYSKLQSKTIDFLRFPFMLMVVFIHVSYLQNINSKSVGYDFYRVVVALGHDIFTSVAVPGFFMFSGFYFFYHINSFTKSLYFIKLKRRLRTLFIPYISWNIIALGLAVMFALKNGESIPFLEHISLKNILSLFWNYSTWYNSVVGQIFYGPRLLPLWFLRDLLLVVLISPLIYYFIKYTSWFIILLFGILYYFKLGFVVFNYNLNQLITAIFFFSFGAFFSINSKNIVLEFRKRQKIWGILTCVFLLGSVFSYKTDSFQYLIPLYIIFGLVTIINLTSYLLERNKIKEIDFLSKSSFFIYLSHSLYIISHSKSLLDKLIPVTNYYFLSLNYFLTPFLCSVVCILIYMISCRFFPKIMSFITGNRVVVRMNLKNE